MSHPRTAWSRRTGGRRAAGLAFALAVPGFLVLPGAGVPAHAAGEDPCDPQILADTDRTKATPVEESLPLVRMHVPEAHRITRGGGTTVAVVDSGVGAVPGLEVRNEGAPGFGGRLLSGHGTIVAGLVAGPDGAAPDARILSMRVLDKDDPDPEQGQRGVSSAAMAAGLQRLADLHASDPIDVVNVSLAVRSPDPALEAAVNRLLDLDVVVVAAAGNVPSDDDAGGDVGGDADVYPADYPGVVAVGAVGADPFVDVRQHVLPNRETVVAAPGGGGLSINLNGQRCQVPADQVATSYAAASVSGVVALLRARFPDENRKQVVARLTRTAEGSELAPNRWTGAGVVQAADALTHQLAPDADGTIRRSEQAPRSDAQAPPPPERRDVHGPSRTMLLWFGLLAGALAGLAFVARPLLRRLG